LKGNEKARGKFPPNKGRPQDVAEKENTVPYERFNTVEKGRGENQAIGSGRE